MHRGSKDEKMWSMAYAHDLKANYDLKEDELLY